MPQTLEEMQYIDDLLKRANKWVGADPDAQWELGHCYEKHSHGLELDDNDGQNLYLIEAINWYEKSVKQGNKRGEHHLAQCYLKLAKDIVSLIDSNIDLQSFYNFKNAAIQRSPRVLANVIANSPCVKCIQKGKKWLLKRAQRGDATAQIDMGDFFASLYYDKDGVDNYYYKTKNYKIKYSRILGIKGNTARKETLRWYQIAANQGDARAQFRLGNYFNYPTFHEANKETAIVWYRKAAEQGYSEAQFVLGEIEADRKIAVQWFRKAAEQEHVEAQFRLATCYQYGDGVEKDGAMVVEWHQKAAENGCFKAMDALGRCYEQEGSILPQDFAQACAWYVKLQKGGYYYGRDAEHYTRGFLREYASHLLKLRRGELNDVVIDTHYGLDEHGAKILAWALENNITVTTFTLRGYHYYSGMPNVFNLKGIKILVQTLEQLRTLEVIRMDNNGIDLEGMKILLPALEKLPLLREAHLQGNIAASMKAWPYHYTWSNTEPPSNNEIIWYSLLEHFVSASSTLIKFYYDQYPNILSAAGEALCKRTQHAIGNKLSQNETQARAAVLQTSPPASLLPSSQVLEPTTQDEKTLIPKLQPSMPMRAASEEFSVQDKENLETEQKTTSTSTASSANSTPVNIPLKEPSIQALTPTLQLSLPERVEEERSETHVPSQTSINSSAPEKEILEREEKLTVITTPVSPASSDISSISAPFMSASSEVLNYFAQLETTHTQLQTLQEQVQQNAMALNDIRTSLPTATGAASVLLQTREQELESVLSKETQILLANKERQLIFNDDKLADYYYTFQVQFRGVFLACAAIHSGMVDNVATSGLRLFGEAAEAAASAIPLGGMVLMILGKVCQKWGHRERKNFVNHIARFLISETPSEVLIETLARQLTLAQAKTLKALEAPHAGFIKQQLHRLTELKDKLLLNDIDTDIRRKADADCHTLFEAMVKEIIKPHPTLNSLDEFIAVIMGLGYCYRSPCQQDLIPHSQPSVHNPLSIPKETVTTYAAVGLILETPTAQVQVSAVVAQTATLEQVKQAVDASKQAEERARKAEERARLAEERAQGAETSAQLAASRAEVEKLKNHAQRVERLLPTDLFPAHSSERGDTQLQLLVQGQIPQDAVRRDAFFHAHLRQQGQQLQKLTEAHLKMQEDLTRLDEQQSASTSRVIRPNKGCCILL